MLEILKEFYPLICGGIYELSVDFKGKYLEGKYRIANLDEVAISSFRRVIDSRNILVKKYR